MLCLEQEEEQGRELAFAIEMRDGSKDSSFAGMENQTYSQKKKQTIVTGAGSRTLTWRQQLLRFINEQPGDYVDQRWQQNYFDEFKILGLETDQSNTSRGGVGHLYEKVGTAMNTQS